MVLLALAPSQTIAMMYKTMSMNEIQHYLSTHVSNIYIQSGVLYIHAETQIKITIMLKFFFSFTLFTNHTKSLIRINGTVC